MEQMKVDVISRYADVSAEQVRGKNAVVIDVFRTTSVIVTALQNGAECVIPAITVEEAWELYHSNQGGQVLLAGEREALPIDGFHLTNSPLLFTGDRVRGKRIVLTTSNGTRAIRSCLNAENLLIASFLNASSVAYALGERNEDVVLVCSGTMGTFSLEDGLCAGMIISTLAGKRDIRVGDLGWSVRVLHHDLPTSEAMRDALQEGSLAYRYLEGIGCLDDVDFCLQADVSQVLPVHESASIRIG
jgi:2-phosphosulfolactate phosphatase